ncbi:hypothetical protein SCHPADRAFT_891366 [Schizopora paradoxa]|uniref:Uncharacterized protein n=1 Tax=Schizopora paradoxa TaxID=27342 RepID=A0A0H2S471_9AGAM|nr:hypothetical protein SCHPADRAFT_891366 [Schizopora paradoxa]
MLYHYESDARTTGATYPAPLLATSTMVFLPKLEELSYSGGEYYAQVTELARLIEKDVLPRRREIHVDSFAENRENHLEAKIAQDLRRVNELVEEADDGGQNVWQSEGLAYVLT